MLGSILIAAALIAIPAVQEVPAGPQRQLVLEMWAKTTYPDGKTGGTAGESDADRLTGYVYSGATGCELGAASKEPIGVKSAGWRIDGRVLQRVGDSLFVRIEWQRLWEQSRRLADGLKGSMDVWMREGDRLPLDEINSTPSGACQANGMRLEATVADRPVPPPSAKMSGVEVGGGAGAGSGRVEVASHGPGIASTTPVQLDVWLVHTRADGTEAEQHQRLSTPAERFRFSPIAIATSAGTATVQVDGSLAAVVDVSGERQLRLSVQRVVTGGAASRGVSVSAYRMPGPDDVYAIELPQLRVKGEIVKSDRVSIRIRLAK